MEMVSEQRIPAPRDRVWAALNDTEILKAAMPGCESFDAVGENEYTAQLTAKVGPVKARFKFKVNLTEVDPPNGYTIVGEGQGGAAGFAKGSAKVALSEDGDGTLLAYAVKASVGGKLAQLGARLIDGTAKKMADEFFGNFIELVGGAEAEDSAGADVHGAAAAETESAAAGTPMWIYAVAGIVIAALLAGAFF